MQDQPDLFGTPLTRHPWNKGKIVAAKQHREAVAFGYVAGKWRPAA